MEILNWLVLNNLIKQFALFSIFYRPSYKLNQDDVSEFFTYEQPSYNYWEFISDIGGALGIIILFLL